ncbi:hypothetical protein MPSEU_000575800 [Mayamaea pseudoterrestris]|nr:hypothetical protein MPSEU_000575800 [Mayamaea pseudoterrestris]
MEDPTLFGVALTTHREHATDPASDVFYFQLEQIIAAISICFFRTTITVKDEPLPLQVFFSLLLGVMAYRKESYETICAVELFSYALPFLLGRWKKMKEKPPIAKTLQWIAISAAFSFLLAQTTISGKLFKASSIVTPRFVTAALNKLFPIQEMKEAYRIIQTFSNPDILRKQVGHLLFVTFHIQAGMGYLGINFLRTEQERRNQLLRMDMYGDDQHENANGGATSITKQQQATRREALMERAINFKRMAGPFIIFSALPYMFQIILYGNINKFAFTCFQHDIHRNVRLHQLFDHDSHLTAMAIESSMSPESYARSMNNVVNTVYELFNRKIFSLPKIMLLPTVMSKQPLLVAKVFPLIIGSDWLKATVVAYMTNKIEHLQKETQELQGIRSKVEAFDIKNAELLQRSGLGATQFTRKRWEEMTVNIQNRLVVQDLISRSKDFFSFMQRNFVFVALIDCALADLIALSRITAADTFVYSRAYEDAIDMLLMRSRGEAELARMMTEIDKLQDLAGVWERSRDRKLLPCRLASPAEGKSLVIRNLQYSRGTALARADHLELRPGFYALTGGNGSGKSTLFRLLMSCETNEKSVDLPSSINLLTPTSVFTEEDDIVRESSCETEHDIPVILEEVSTRLASQEIILDMDGKASAIAGAASGKPRALNELHPRLSITMPSSSVVEISQTFYWPLHSRPIDWIYHEDVLGTCTPAERLDRARAIAVKLQDLEFFQKSATNSTEGDEDDLLEGLIRELIDEKDDWFGDLSGGQKSKVELVRKVLLHDRCPDVLLIDETMAPLDPTSKSLVMSKLKAFCRDSVVIVIYHTDVGVDKQVEGKTVECIPSNDFFDRNIHLEKGIVHVRGTC